MAKVPVQSYTAEWNPKSNKGRLAVYVQGRPYELTIETTDEFSTLMLLVSKSNVLIDTDTWDIELSPRPVGT